MQTLALPALVAAAFLFAPTGFGQTTLTEDFTLPDGPSLGPGWTKVAGDFSIQSGRAVGVAGILEYWDPGNLITYNGYKGDHSGASVAFDFDANGVLGGSCTAMLGLDSSYHAICAQLWDTDMDGLFDEVQMTQGATVNDWFWDGYPTYLAIKLAQPLATGRMILEPIPIHGVRLRVLDSQGNVFGDQIVGGIHCEYCSWPSGTDFGVATRGAVAIDNFELTYHDLAVLPEVLSYSQGGQQDLKLQMGPAHAGEVYLMLGSLAGTFPGTPLAGGGVLPLNQDTYTMLTLLNPTGGFLTNSIGVLDAQGSATVTFTLPPKYPLAYGLLAFHAAVVFSTGPGPLIVTPTNVTGVEVL